MTTLHPRWLPLLDLGLIALLIAVYPRAMVPRPPGDRERVAVAALRALGSAQLSYQDSNLDKVYGRFELLQAEDYVPPEATAETWIPQYRISQFDVQHYTGFGCGDGGFTIVATPDSRWMRLRTFSVCDDQTIRVAPPVMGPRDENPCNWEPTRDGERGARTANHW